jgi:adenine-specific DNA methylase
MKYMGSKRTMLLNGLGHVLERELHDSRRFVDLFTGSAAVASHVAQKFDVPVLACDLQRYSVVLASAVVTRRRKLSAENLWEDWFTRAEKFVHNVGRTPVTPRAFTKAAVASQRNWCSSQIDLSITSAYGGHYFSAKQAVWIDALRATLPRGRAARRAALAALIQAASFCAASPGHTAQPFQPTRTASQFLQEAWSRSVLKKTKQQLRDLCQATANRFGRAILGDANTLAKSIRKSDLVFVDPPYSGVHYSRFYHVLETIARGRSGEVSGIGRYPAPSRRPWSRYSVQSESRDALEQLLITIARRGAKIVLTFPDHKCSNGLSGYLVKKIAKQHFHVRHKSVASRFSSLGGTSDNRGGQAGRSARMDARELVLTLTPRTSERRR